MRNLNTADHLDRLAARRPDATGLVDEHARLTWGEVGHRSRRLAAALVASGLPRGAVVYAQLPSSVELFLLRLACERAGLRLATAAPAFRESEIRRMVAATTPALAVVPGIWRGTDFGGLLEQAGAGSIPRLALARWSGGAGRTLEAFEAAAPPAPQWPALLAGRALGEREASQLGTTSGTTGAPRLVEVTIGARLATARVQATRYGVGEDDVVLALTPLITGTADALGYHGAPQVGFTLVLTGHFDAAATARAVAAHRATVVIGVPTMAMRLLACPESGEIPARQVRLFCSHGAILPRAAGEALEAALGCRVMQAYGTFDYGGICATSAGDGDDVRLATVGRPLDGNEVAIVDERGAPVAPGAAGRLYVRGVHANAGYHRAPEATRAAWATGYHDVGEIARQDADGNVVLLGRARDLIIRGGQNIAPGEIEDLLARHPDVAEVAVIGLPEPVLGEIACACVVRRPGRRLTGDDVLAFLRAERIAAFKLPERVEFFEALPLLPAGHKVDRRQLRDAVLKGDR